MAVDFDRKSFVNDLGGSLQTKKEAADLAQKLVAKGLDRVYFVGCGAPNRDMLVFQYWLERLAPKLEVHRYFPAEFVTQEPARIDERTVVVLGSKSGTTPETVSAAEYAKDFPCKTVGITQTADRPLAKAVDFPLLLGEGGEAHTGMFIALMGFTAGLLKATEEWDLYEKAMRSLDALPEALADVTEQNDARTAEEARLYKDDRIIYEIAAGPVFSTAYVFGVCILMEMQWMHSYPIEAAEFFHGPFEIIDETMPVLLLLGEDPSRPLTERAVKFCKKYTERLMIYDSKDFELNGVDPEIRPFLSPIVLQTALQPLAERLAVWHNQPLSTRRYMWKTEY